MLKAIKSFTVRMIAGANVATILVMLLVGSADRVDPVAHPMLSCVGLLFPFFLFVNLVFLFFWLLFKWKYALIPVLGFIISYVPVRTYLPLNAPRSVPDGAIKLLSYNVFNFGDGDEPRDSTNGIVRYLLEQNADIVCLQEVSVDIRSDRPIGEALRRVYRYKDIRQGSNGGDCVALLCKFPIVAAECVDYTSRGNVTVAYQVVIDGDTVLLLNNHLETMGLSFDDKENFQTMVKGNMRKDTAEQVSKLLVEKLGEAAAKRAPQVDSVACYIDRHPGMSVILCGDFNDGPNSYAHRRLSERLTDCFVESGNGPGISYNRYGFYFRIDNIMCSSDWEPFGCKVDSKIKVSDHYPIYCWLKKR